MAKEKKPPEPTGEVPMWFLTYTDVITLLMTFFILLLTFSTDQPEEFQILQGTMFGDPSGLGAMVKKPGDSEIIRERPRDSRVSDRGSEIPPEQADPGMDMLDKGLKSFQEDEQIRDPSATYSIDLPLNMLMDSSGELTAFGKNQLHQLAVRLKKGTCDPVFEISTLDDFEKVHDMVLHLVDNEGISYSRVGIAATDSILDPTKMRLSLRQRTE
ncbi:MAG: hypothetical protein KDA87_19875 [Planctomycetales bacterium]|nr:hypothetical protein [Planctomycetales bacterium]